MGYSVFSNAVSGYFTHWQPLPSDPSSPGLLVHCFRPLLPHASPFAPLAVSLPTRLSLTLLTMDQQPTITAEAPEGGQDVSDEARLEEAMQRLKLLHIKVLVS